MCYWKFNPHDAGKIRIDPHTSFVGQGGFRGWFPPCKILGCKMTVEQFVHWAEGYIKSKGWNVPVSIHTGFVRIGVPYQNLKSYDDYSVRSILDCNPNDPILGKDNSKLQITVRMNLERLYSTLETLSRVEKIKETIRRNMGGK